MAQCKKCGKAIEWRNVRNTRTGKTNAHPVNPVMLEIVLTDGGPGTYIIQGHAVKARRSEKTDHNITLGFESHFATCTFANKFRREKK